MHSGVGEALAIGGLWAALTAKLPVPAKRGRQHFFARGGLCAHFVAHRVGRTHEWLVNAPSPSTSTVTTSPGSTGRDTRAYPKDHVAGHQGDQPRNVGHEIVHVPRHLIGGAVLANHTIDARAH